MVRPELTLGALREVKTLQELIEPVIRLTAPHSLLSCVQFVAGN